MAFKHILATLLLTALPFFAYSQEIRSIRTEVSLEKDGSAQVVQTWDASVVSGTEWYIPISNLGEMTISDFSVSENGEQYINEGGWDVDRTLEEKAGRCGIVDKGRGGVELCWGQGSYGHHVWTCRYRISGLVQSLDDYDAFNHQFVNPGLIATPQYVEIHVINNTGGEKWTYDNTRIWAFGFEGEINLVDGEIVGTSSGRVQYLNLMVRFDKGLFNPAVSRGGSFEAMQNKAFKGSSYEEKASLEEILWVIVALIAIGLILGFIIYMIICLLTGHKYRKSMFGQSKITGWFREAPLGGDIASAWYVYKNSGRFSSPASPESVVGTYFLRWILNGGLSVISNTDKPGRIKLAFTDKTPEFSCDEERWLYNMALEASGDRVLEASEFKRWSKTNYERLSSWPGEIGSRGFANLVEKGYLRGSHKAVGGKEAELRKVIELKNFLKDFTLSGERVAEEVKLWKDYLVYAQMFGIASKVAKQFKNLYPEFFSEVAESTGLDSMQLLYMVSWTNRLSSSGYAAALSELSDHSSKASGGFGGGTSFGGGGGFSGGGFGGGSR